MESSEKVESLSDNFERLKKCTIEVLSVEADQVKPEAVFGADLEADSLDLMELVMALEEEFDITVEEEELDGVEKVSDALTLVESKL